MKKSFGAKTLAYPTPVWLVGCYDEAGNPNAMTAAWAGICCSQPPCVTVSIQKIRYSYNCILKRKAYTVNVASEKYAKEADYFGIASGKNEDKFKVTGLTPVKSELVDAPYIEEFPMVLECQVIHVLEIGIHTVFIGEIKDVKVDESVLDANGMPDVEKVKPFVFSPQVRAYHGIGGSVGKAFDMGRAIK
jgi:flavin reductase (DIM6/NTAB) family NADH-FMN oxidoreductase RutF